MDTASRRAALEFAWGQFRTFDLKANRDTTQLKRFRLWGLVLTVTGATLGVLSTEDYMAEDTRRIIAILAAVALAIVGWLGKNLLSPQREQAYARTRATAEKIKSRVFLFLMSAGVYKGNSAVNELLSDIRALQLDASDLNVPRLLKEEKLDGIPDVDFTVDDFIEHRVDDQMNYFIKRSNDFTKVVKTLEVLTLTLIFASVVLGTVNPELAGWLALIAAVNGALAAYAQSGRYQQNLVNYRVTADLLEIRKARWETGGAKDPEAEEAFVNDCEQILGESSGSWLAGWSSEKDIEKPEMPKPTEPSAS